MQISTVQQQLTAAFIQKLVDEAAKKVIERSKPKRSRVLDIYHDPDAFVYNVSLYVDDCGDVVVNGRISKK